MKWNRNRAFWSISALLSLCLCARADLQRWVQDIASPGNLQAVFFRAMALPAGPIDARRPPKETRPELGKLIVAAPVKADLYALRALEAEQQLDFAAAETDWKQYAELNADKIEGNFELSFYYHRRLDPKQEISALEVIGRAPTPAAAKFKPASEQPSWEAWDSIQTLIEEQDLPADLAIAEYRAWIARYPAEPSVYRKFFDDLLDRKRFDDAQKLIADYQRAFPADLAAAVDLEASLAGERGTPEQAAQIYDRAFQPLWPPELIQSYFSLLKSTHGLRRYLDQARAQVAAKPGDIAPAARLFYYYQQANNLPEAQRALYEYRKRKTAYTADELWTLAKLFEIAQNGDEAARDYVALYSLNPPGNQQRALAALASLLLNVTGQPIRFGAGDLSFYRDIATMDPGPGFLNGVLSLLLNSTGPQFHYDTENEASRAYFQRAQAAELIALLDRRFPNERQRAELHSRLISAYGVYGDDPAVIRAGVEFLKAFPNSPEHGQVALLMADAYARANKTHEEFALYDTLLKELAAKADNVPLGEQALAKTGEAGGEPEGPVFRRRALRLSRHSPLPKPATTQQAEAAPPSARSPEYARVLDRYIGRLVSLRRVPQALALYKREILADPNDPGLYERLAGFVEQNNMTAEVEQVYRKAMAQFPDRTWSHKLARWYLKRKQTAQFDALTREVVKIFSGTELEAYLSDAGPGGGALSWTLYRQVNLYAHQRFPNDLQFVRNLMSAYGHSTADAPALEALLRQYWYYADDLRDRFFEYLSRTGKLKTELAPLTKPDAATNPAAARFVAEGEAWRSHFETAAPLFRAVAVEYPGDASQQTRAASMYRSLATYDGAGKLANTEIAAGLEENATKAAPRDAAFLTTTGEIWADREAFSRARSFWNRIAAIEPGQESGYVEAATVFWDYYRFDDALRLIHEGRQRLNDPRLFSYEAGAIYENQRDYTRAIQEYAKGALADEPEAPSRSRLVTLSKRTAQRALIEDLTSKAASRPDATFAAVSLRIEILQAGNHTDELRKFLLATANSTKSFEVLQSIDATCQARAFEDVCEHSKLRELALTTDPVERMAGQIEMAKFYEGHHDLDSARRTIASLYKDNPAVLGVIRAATDFYWRNKDSKHAIDLLAEAARRAQPDYRDQFTLEAARKATEVADYKRAREFLAELLGRDAFRSEYVAAMSDTYARQGDDKGLRDFYNDRLKAIQQAPLSADEKTSGTASLRRGLIPVLTRLKDYTGAIDQYIEILNRYPEDDGLAREVASYASGHGRERQLVAYYENSAKQSPRDYRWPMVEARVQAQLENFPAAVAAYVAAAAIRPDRIDFYSERAGLEERLLRFNEAAATYAKLYELSYRNSAWMERVAAVQARQGHNAEAVKALNAALIEGRPVTPDGLFNVAQRLEGWNMLAEAADYAERGVTQAGAALLGEYSGGVQTYLKIMTRKRQYDVAWQKVSALAPNPPVDAAKTTLEGAQRSMGAAVEEYYTPEEKSIFATWIGARVSQFLPAIQAAGLTNLQAKALANQPQPLIALQQSRLEFDALGSQLEAYWNRLPPQAPDRDSFLDQAAINFERAGDTAAEVRVLSLRDQQGGLAGAALTRFIELLVRTPSRMETVASSDASDDVRNAVANYALNSGDATLAFRAVAARGRSLPPIWTRAYTALTGLYFAQNTPLVNDAFKQALGAGTIGQRIGKPVDRDQQLAGDLWYYYGSRYGEYIGVSKQADAEDYLPSGVEARPGSSASYYDLAEYYRDANQADRAIEEYRYALQLDAHWIGAHDKLGVLLFEKGEHDEGIAELRRALDAAARQQDERGIAERFWTDLAATIEDIGKLRVLDTLRPDVERVLRTYIRRNGDYKVEPLLRAAFEASGSPDAGIAWVLDLSKSAANQPALLWSFVAATWIPDAQRPAIYRAALDLERAKPEMEDTLRRGEIDFITWLVAHNHAAEAQAVLSGIPTEQRNSRLEPIIPLEVQIAVQTRTLETLLNRYGARADVAERLSGLQTAANVLEASKNHAAAQQVLEFVYTRQIEMHQLSAAAFLGLAKIRIEQKDVAAALALLRRMTMIVGEPFENLVDAGRLLEDTGHPTEAIPFFEQRVQAVPWDSAARVSLARLKNDVPALLAIAQSAGVLYESRAAAAQEIGKAHAGPLAGGSGELTLLASTPFAPNAAEKPYFYYARKQAAGQSKDAAVQIRLLSGAISIAPNADANDKRDLIQAALNAKRYRLAVSVYDQWAPQSEQPEAFRRKIGQALEAIGDLARAQSFYLGAGAEADAKRVQATFDRNSANGARAPVVTQNLEQDHPVRPRLVASAGGSR